MGVELMVTDEWHGVHNAEHEVEAPSIEQIEAAVERLDASQWTLVTLMLQGEAHMAIGGGRGQYVAYVTADNIQFQQLTAESAGMGPEVALVVGGQEGRYAKRFVVDLDAVLRAARYFYADGSPDPTQTWTTKP